MGSIGTLKDSMKELIETQIQFQVRTSNDLPEDLVRFEHVQTSLSHNVYQMVEWQEFMEADASERQEELIDYLLFMLNKYIYLGIKPELGRGILGTLWSKSSNSSICQCDNLARIEQNDYITLIRRHCQFKPWKVRTLEDSANIEEVKETYNNALCTFKQIANIVFDSYEDFLLCLNHKLDTNNHRQNTGY